MSRADHRGRVGQTVEVLVEGPSKTARKDAGRSGPVQLTGRTPTDHIVVFDGNERLVGRMVAVFIEAATSFTLFGRVLTGEQVGAVGDVAPAEFGATPTTRLSLPLV